MIPRSFRNPARPLAVLLLFVGVVVAQAPTGAAGVYIAHDPPRIGGDVIIDMGHPGLPNETVILSLSDGFGPTNHPILGPVWLDITSAAYQILFYNTDISGNFQLVVPLGSDPSLFGTLTLFANAFMSSPNLASPGWGLSKTVRLDYQTLDGWNPTGGMNLPRIGHSATSLAMTPRSDESRVLIAGGGGGTMIFPNPSATTEFYNPMRREFQLGPSMGLARWGHRAVALADGRVLITGGVYNQGGVVTATCEIFDPQANLFVPTGPMSVPRTAHALTLLQDGRVLCTGGYSNWANAGSQFGTVLASAQDTAEIYDPATGLWSTLTQTMSSRRSGHTHTLLPNGQVLIVGGVSGSSSISGGITSVNYIPVHTSTSELFQPGTDLLLPAGLLGLARGWHGASLLNNGSVLVTGGTASTGSSGAAAAQASCEVWNGAIWQAGPPLSVTTAFHTQTRSNWNGDAIVVGGYASTLTSLSGNALSARHNGVAMFDTLSVGLHPSLGGATDGRGFHTTTQLYDGSYLVCGGSDQTTVLDNAYTIVEN